PEERPHPLFRFFDKLWGPVPWLLEAAMLLQLGIGAYVESAVIGALLLFNAVLGFVQEGRAGAALAALKKQLSPTALARRDGQWVRLAAAEVVPGDTLRLALGALVPADVAVVSGAVTVDQSMLTGESVPVEAVAGSQVYAGSLVRSGQAIAEVKATGRSTYFGRAAELVRVSRSASTEQAAILATVRTLGLVNGVFAVLLFVGAWAVSLPIEELFRLALTMLLATIPVALPATFALSAALGAQRLARQGVLLTRLSAAHEAAAMDVLCADKTGTLTRNELNVVQVSAMPGFDEARVLALAALASSEADQDPIDEAIRAAAATAKVAGTEQRLTRFIPFDPATKVAEAFVVDRQGNELRIIKGAFVVIAEIAQLPPDARRQVAELAERGHRVIAVAAGPAAALQLVGLIAVSDSPREDSPRLVATLRDFGVRTVMVTGDSALTATAIARKVGIEGVVCSPERSTDGLDTDECGVYARTVPEEKHRIVRALQSRGHVVGMCGDGTNDAPALRQAQIGIAVSTATDVAKAAAGIVLTEPGLAGVVSAIREGRTAFQRLLAYTLNMLVKKIEIVLFLAVGLVLTGHAILTPVLMIVMMVTNDFLSMSLTTDRASFARAPAVWRMRRITAAAVVLGLCKLSFSAALLALGKHWYGLSPGEGQTLALVILVFGNQALLYVLREQRHMWSSRPSGWVLAGSMTDIAITTLLALSGTLMDPLAWHILATVLAAATAFAAILDQIKRLVLSAVRIE
ncbi:MAG: HAD-IC family P-type ATPase, partial [Aureliella sp.]